MSVEETGAWSARWRVKLHLRQSDEEQRNPITLIPCARTHVESQTSAVSHRLPALPMKQRQLCSDPTPDRSVHSDHRQVNQ